MRAYFESLNFFTEEELDRLTGVGTDVSVKKGDYFIREGAICKKVAILKSGLFRSFYYNSDQQEATYCLTFPNNFLTAYTSFITQTPSKESIQALSDAEMIIVSKEELDELQAGGQKWVLFAKNVAEQQYIELENRIFQLQREKAETRYQNLMEEHPEYIQHIPLQHLASYLGISQRHLSRIRKQISN